MSEKRFYALRDLLIAKGVTVKAGSYLEEEHLKTFTPSSLFTAVRRCCIYDVTGELDISWSELGKYRLRLKSLEAIGGEEAAKLVKLIDERRHEGRYGKPRVSAKLKKSLKEVPPKAEPKKDQPKEEEDALLDDKPEPPKPAPKPKTRRRRGAAK